MASLLSNSRRRRIDKSCHFCGASTSKDCRCGGWSRKDQFGKLLDYLPEMSDVSLNPIPISPDRSFHNQISPKPSPSDSDRKPIRSSEEKPDQSDSPFCRTCRTNQMLQLNLLANYLPDDDTDQTMTEPLNSSSSSRDLMRDLPRYKKRLESRYPVVCPGCSKRVTKIIKDKDYRLKAQSFSDSIKKFTSVTNIKSINLKGRSVSKGSSSLNFNIRKLRWFAITRALWSFGGSLWRFSHLLGIVTAIYCTISNPKNLIETRSLSKSCLSHSWNQFNFFGDTCKLLYCFHLVDFICSMSYDPTWLRAHKLKVQGIKVDLKGRKRLLLLNILSFILRSMVLEYLALIT
ncbi:hypothetical protein BY996DRAFT_2644148 [Phakopsora pachyrhizi]|nr:hypothetical protein BY996DRAFT_2644148 [Phakopsora pachyrhizi]